MIAIDITSCGSVSLGGKKYVHVKIDMGSGKLFLSLLKRTSDVIKDMILFVKNVKLHWNRDIKYIRCDNSGENNKLKKFLIKSFQM